MKNMLKLREHFIGEGLEINPPVKKREIIEFEDKNQVALPDDIKEYFLLFNGTGEGNFGDSGYAFFALEELRQVSEVMSLSHEESITYKDFYAFSDYMIWCWGYAIKLTQVAGENHIYSVGIENTNDLKVADSFSEFVEVYLSYPDDVIGSS